MSNKAYRAYKIDRLSELKEKGSDVYAPRLLKTSLTTDEASRLLTKSPRYVRQLAAEGWLDRYTRGFRRGHVIVVSIIAFLWFQMERADVPPFLIHHEITELLRESGLIA